MKFTHLDFACEVNLEEGEVQHLIVESPYLMSELINDFKMQMSGRSGKWILSHEGRVLDLGQIGELIFNIFDLDINQRKVLNILFSDLKSEIIDTELLLWRSLNTDIENLISTAAENLGYEISYDELDPKILFKAIDLKLKDYDEPYVPYLFEYLQLISEILKKKLFIFVNLTSFLGEKEIEYLYEEAKYRKYYLLLLDSHDVFYKSISAKKMIIDQDYCVINPCMK